MTKDIVPVITKELQPVANEALTLKIKSHGDMLVATELLSKLNQLNDKIQQEKERVTVPLNAALKAERSRWKPAEGFYQDAIEHVREEMTRYQTESVRKQKEAEKKIADKLSEGSITLDKAVAKFDKIKAPEKEVATEAGLVQFRETQVLKIWDHTMIPIEYMLPDEKAILTALKEGKKVAGCEIEIIQTPVNYR